MDSSLYLDGEIANIYHRQFHTVYRVCLSFMKNTEDAEDMVQETFLKLINCEMQFESEEHERAWLIVTASNTCKNELRRWKRRLENIRVLSHQETFIQENDNNVLEWVMTLPVKYRQVIYLYYYEGYRTSEIAGMLHCPESTVRNQLLRGRRLLKKNTTYSAKSGAFLAAVLAGSLLVATTAYAVYSFGLRDLHLGKENVLDLSGRNSWADEIVEKDIPTQEVDLISLGGIAESPEYQACSEWRLFQENYDADGTIRAEIGNGFAGLAEEYELVYGCYTQEMADEVDRLCEKYVLSRLTDFSLADDYDDLCRQAEVGNFCRSVEGNTGWFFYGGYVYADQTFYMEGKAAWKGSTLYTANYGLTRTMKGSFYPVTLNIGAIEDYHEWNYTTGNGQNVLLANSNSKALILAEREQSFLVVNVWDDFASDTYEISDEMLEGLADIFDFSEIP